MREDTKFVCRADSDIEDVKGCIHNVINWCPDQAVVLECVDATLKAKERERKAQEEQAKAAQQAAQQAQHEAWCQDLEKQLPELLERARVRSPPALWYGGFGYMELRMSGVIPPNDCLNVQRAIDRYFGARIGD